MHHTLYLIIQASDPHEAIEAALSHIEDWGTDNNWRTAVGAISQKTGKVTQPKKRESHHFAVAENALKQINEMFQNKINNPVPEWLELDRMKGMIQKLVDGNFSGETIQKMAADKNNSFWAFKQFAMEIYGVYNHVKYHPNEPFDVFKHEYRPYDYDEISVTHIDVGDEVGEDDDLYCIAIDMHT